MDDEHSRRFWEQALRDIRDDGFFAPVQTAEPPEQEEVTPPEPLPRSTRRLTNLHLVLIVVALALILAIVVVNWLAPALI
jgi:hypothetical protein